MPEFPISHARYAEPIWAYFPDIDAYRLVSRYGLPSGADLWAGDYGPVLTPRGPTRFRYVHPASGTLH